MKQSVLLTLLPILAALSPLSITGVTAHGHHHHHHSSSTSTPQRTTTHRKTLGFGLSHPHADYKVLSPDESDILATRISAIALRSLKEVEGQSDDFVTTNVIQGGKSDQLDQIARKVAIEFVKMFIVGSEKGDDVKSFFIRDDSYTDKRTLTSHIYLRQIVNGLEVVDGDVNVNIGRDGNVLSWGSSFYPGDAPAPGPIESTTNLNNNNNNQDPAGYCADLDRLIADHAAYQATASQVVLDVAKSGLEAVGSALFGDAGARFVASHLRAAENNVDAPQIDSNAAQHLNHMIEHLNVLCGPTRDGSTTSNMKRIPSNLLDSPVGAQDLAYNDAGMFSAKQALAKVFRDLLPSHNIVPDDTDLLDLFTSHHETTLTSKYAQSEPPVEVISNVPFVIGADAENSVDDGQVKARLVYHQVRDESSADQVSLKLCWRFDVPLEDNWYDIHVDTVSGEIISAVDYVSDAPPSRKSREIKNGGGGGKQKPLPVPKPSTPPFTYSIFPFGVNDPSVGNISSVTEPWDNVASPAGWHAFPDKANLWIGRDIKGVTSGNTVGNSSVKWTNATTTIGNNVFAQEDWAGQSQWLTNSRPQNSSMIFDYEYGEPEGLRPQEYVDFATTQLFYTSNMYHDLLYRLGFDEVSGNFQMENWGKGGRGGDAVLAYAQAGEGTNNANFATPPDGTQPRMRMYLWSTNTPYRDGDLEAGIVIHEYSHGLSTRLTGGPMNSGCLGYGEAGGMGEGWGDAMATFIRQIEEYSEHGVYAMGAWAANTDKGIRNYKYSSNSTINPSTYKTLDKPGYWGVHAIGEVWAEFLFVLEELLVKKHGFSATLFPPEDTSVPNEYYRNVSSIDAAGKPTPLIPIHGNSLMVQLIVDGMKLQPCRPSFSNARDAIIAADLALTGGENTCDIWAAFGGRGLGIDAAIKGQLPWGGGIREEDFTIPKSCTKKGKGKH